jgi:hydroxypyruvate reductase
MGRPAERAAHVDLIARAAVAAADPADAVRAAIGADTGLRTARRVFVLAIGKAAWAMSHAALSALPRLHDTALIVVPHATPVDGVAAVAGTRVLFAAHPLPDAASAAAAEQVVALLADAADGDVVVALISGGASSLCAAPADPITIGDYAAVVHALQVAGADIRELNTVRAQIDRLKGGGMARLAAPARVLGLIVSDVVGSPLDVVASGPLSPARTSPADAVDVLQRHGLWADASDSVRRVLTRTDKTRVRDSQPDFEHVTLRVIADNDTAVAGAADAARDLGYDVRVAAAPVTGPAREAGLRMARAAGDVAGSLRPGDRPVCLLSGGETTVVVKGSGIGGRNQELVLAGAIALRGIAGITVASLGTDGVDGPTDAAGAIADGDSVARGERAGIDAALALDNNDSYSFFNRAGGHIMTGPTGTNVMDVQVALVDAPRSGTGSVETSAAR